MKWKDNPERKPLVIRGARQVGKTWLMKAFGESCYESYAYFNFDEEDELKSVFETNKNPQRIIELLSMIAGEKILPGETLLIFDEVQECPHALNALKYFKEKANGYHVVAAGSLLGTLLAQPKSYPMNFSKRPILRSSLTTKASEKIKQLKKSFTTVCLMPTTTT